jgi:hypothetical protein
VAKRDGGGQAGDAGAHDQNVHGCSPLLFCFVHYERMFVRSGWQCSPTPEPLSTLLPFGI